MPFHADLLQFRKVGGCHQRGEQVPVALVHADILVLERLHGVQVLRRILIFLSPLLVRCTIVTIWYRISPGSCRLKIGHFPRFSAEKLAHSIENTSENTEKLI